MRTYIAATRGYNDIAKGHVCAPLFKKVFDYDGASARIEISVVGLYRLWVNGTEITKGWLAPYFSNSNQVVYYDEYDVGGLLQKKAHEPQLLRLRSGAWEPQLLSPRAAAPEA